MWVKKKLHRKTNEDDEWRLCHDEKLLEYLFDAKQNLQY